MQLIYHSTKSYGHDLGLSCAFRQWRAASHCNLLHGYALAIHLDFEAVQLDDRNWVVDFGSLKGLKADLVATFDHKTLIAEDDPELEYFREGARRRLLDLVIVEAVGCERFAQMIAEWAVTWLAETAETRHRVRLTKVVVSEHSGNSAYVEVYDDKISATKQPDAAA